jgi:hypothetical protein
MAKKKRGLQSSEIAFLPGRMTDMLSRTRFNLSRALKPKNWRAFKTAAETCLRCGVGTKCRRWLESHREGEGNPVPDFCPNARFVRANSGRCVPFTHPLSQVWR